METPLSTLLMTYYLILIMNGIFSLFLLITTKDPLYKSILAVWGYSFLNFSLQGIFQQPGFPLLWSFGSYVIVSLYIFRFFSHLNLIRKLKTMDYVMPGFFFITSPLSFAISENFRAASLLMAMAIVYPLLCTARNLIKGNKEHRMDVYCFAAILVGSSVHFLGYPWLRFHPEGVLWSCSIALFFLCFISVLIPGFITKTIANKHNQQLLAEIDRKTKEIKSISDTNAALLSIVCHDLSTPLTVLDLTSDKLFSVDSNEIQCKEAKLKAEKSKLRFRRSLSTMKEVLSEVKTLHALRMGKNPLELKAIKPLDIIHELLDDYEDSLTKKGLSVRVESHISPHDQVIGDHSMLKTQVLSNLLSNAIKFSERGSSIDIILQHKERSTVIEIKDYGIGIPSQLISFLFDMKKITSRQGTDNESGTGFGLPIAKTCMDLMMGRIEVESHYENDSPSSTKGTSFRIYLNRFI